MPRLIETFDATEECKEVACLYNHTNRFIEGLIHNSGELVALEASEGREGYFP